MSETEPLYFDRTDERRFEATVERALDDRLVLDRTCFYPAGGGQPADRGTLRPADDGSPADEPVGSTEWVVDDVQKRDTIYHHVLPADEEGSALSLPSAGATLVGELDWDRRYAHMRYHTAQHLLSALLLDEYDAETTGNQLYANRARLDCRYDRFTDDDLAAIEANLNAWIDEGLPVRWYELPREDAEDRLDTQRTRIDLLPSSITELRIVEIGDDGAPLDRVACAGTHVASTGEIGELTVTGRETAGDGEERIRFELAA